jgi:hypothetical protein
MRYGSYAYLLGLICYFFSAGSWRRWWSLEVEIQGRVLDSVARRSPIFPLERAVGRFVLLLYAHMGHGAAFAAPGAKTRASEPLPLTWALGPGPVALVGAQPSLLCLERLGSGALPLYLLCGFCDLALFGTDTGVCPPLWPWPNHITHNPLQDSRSIM